MLFKFTKSHINIDCFLPEHYRYAYEFSPIKMANKFFPEWIKNAKSAEFNWDEMVGKSSIKNCPGVADMYRNSFILPMWCDFALKHINGSFQYTFADGRSMGDAHNVAQRGAFRPDYLNFKLFSPWRIYCKEDINFLVQGAYYNYIKPLDFEIPPGKVSYKFQSSSNVQMMIPPDKPNIFINQNDPLLHIIPLTEKNIQVTNHVVSDIEYGKKITYGLNLGFIKKYSRAKKLSEENNNKCPFTKK
jgi:hypothetical protein